MINKWIELKNRYEIKRKLTKTSTAYKITVK